MAKFFGKIGYAETIETSPGAHEERIVEENAYGDVFKNNRKLDNGEHINGDVLLNNQISIVASPYASTHSFAIRYVNWMGANWTITNVEIQPPRLILTIGGVYHGPTGWTT